MLYHRQEFACLFARSLAFSKAARQELHYCQAAHRTLPFFQEEGARFAPVCHPSAHSGI